jgi:stage III sporulation protein SpoIIIAA|tara:strand:+ start:1120 stop:2499 length:1380 start_codon:yes stop_codon:yes gene_type:complete
MVIDEDLDKLLDNLPFFIQENLNNNSNKKKLIEIVMDLGRRPEARFTTGPEYLSQKIISWQDIDYSTKRLSRFSNDNRAGIDRTLHRISCMRNRQLLITGLTCRVGRAIFGTINIIRDLLESEQSILILGKPGVGKTTIIREIARVLSDEMEKRVIVVDTSNEIAGDSDIPHSGIGRARRMQVSKTEFQHQVMIEAVENHMPEIIIIDEIGTELEALAASMIAEKGVQLVGTTHGNCLKNLIKNPTLSNLIGGIHYVTLSDDEAKQRGSQKTILERKGYPVFQIVIEINSQNSWTIHEDVTKSIDLLLRKNYSITQIRQSKINEKTSINYIKLKTNPNSLFKPRLDLNNKNYGIVNNWDVLRKYNDSKYQNIKMNQVLIYTYSLSNNLIKEAVAKMGIKIILTKEIKKATLVIGLKKHFKRNLRVRKLAMQRNIPIYTVNRRSVYQLTKLIQFLLYQQT